MKTKSLKNQYWFYIDTYVHISVRKEWGLLYNTLTGKILEYHHKPEILSRLKKLLSAKNLGVIPLTEAELANPEVATFVQDVRGNFMGDLLETRFSQGKPIQMMPLFKIRNDVKYLKSDQGRSVGEHMIKNLMEVSIFINSQCKQHCDCCSKAYTQFNCCRVAAKDKNELPLEKIMSFWEELKSSSLVNINILGGDIFLYSQWAELLVFLNHQPVPKNFYLHYLNAVTHNHQLNELCSDTSQLKLLVTFPVQEKALMDALDGAKQVGLQTSVIFIIDSESDFSIAEQFCTSHSIEAPVFQPFYNGRNRPFFQDNLLVDRKELSQSKLSMPDIHAREMVNILNYGRLTILNNGYIYANINSPQLGTMGQDTLYDILYKEMVGGKTWRKTRKNVKPCHQCVFSSLCPPLSNLNIALGKNNLCSVLPSG